MFELGNYSEYIDFSLDGMRNYVCGKFHSYLLDDMADWLYEQQNNASIGGKNIRDMNFFSAPASTKYHGDYPGGLMKHSIIVAENLALLTKQLDLKWQNPRSPILSVFCMIFARLISTIARMTICTTLTLILTARMTFTIIMQKSLWLCLQLLLSS